MTPSSSVAEYSPARTRPRRSAAAPAWAVALAGAGVLTACYGGFRLLLGLAAGVTALGAGSAAMAGCMGRENLDIVILYPEGRTSEVQRRQMTRAAAANVHAVAIDGSFDDCQAIVKQAFADAELRALNLSAINSINWARIIAQPVYYVAAAQKLGGRPSFAVPTGNFGNVYAAYVGRLMGGANDGAMFAPKYVENKLKFFPHIKEVVAYGDGREKVCVMINIDFDAVGNWAERRNLPYAGYTDLAAKSEVYELIKDCVEKVNADLAEDAMLAGSQVSRFLVLHKELDADDGELTRTNKVRRGFIAEKYAALVDALYAGRTEQYIETQVKFEDGRTGSVSATLKLMDTKTFPPVKSAA